MKKGKTNVEQSEKFDRSRAILAALSIAEDSLSTATVLTPEGCEVDEILYEARKLIADAKDFVRARL